METGQATTISKSQYWQQHFKSWKESGKSRTTYCSENNLRLTTFDYWRKKFREKTVPIKLVQVPTAGRLQMDNSGIRLIVNEHYLIEVETGFCPSTLSQLVKVVRSL